MESTKHLTTEQILDFLEGRLDQASCSVVTTHLASGCKECTANYSFYRRYHNGVQATHWPSPSRVVHSKVISSYEAYFRSIQSQRKTSPFFRPVLIGFAVLTAMLLALILIPPQKNVLAATILKSTGVVEIQESSGSTWIPVTPGQYFHIGSILRTAENGQAEILFPGGEQTILGSSSTLKLDDIFSSHGKWNVDLTQLAGSTDNTTGNATASFVIHTKKGDAQGGQAHFDLIITSEGNSQVNVLTGALSIKTNFGYMTLSSGQSVNLSDQSDQTTATPSPFGQEDVDDTPIPTYTITPQPDDESGNTLVPTFTRTPVMTEDTNNIDPQSPMVPTHNSNIGNDNSDEDTN